MWEYKKIDLNSPPIKKSSEDLLNEAGREGWELISVSSLGVGYLKRPKPQPKSTEAKHPG